MLTLVDNSTDQAVLAAAALRVQLLTFRRRTEVITRRNGMTPERYLLLLLIEADSIKNAQTTVTSLCHPMQMTQSSVSRLVAGSANAGLIHRTFDPEDGRRSYITLTAAGNARLHAAFQELGPERAKLTEVLGRAD